MAFEDKIDITFQELQIQIHEYLQQALRRAAIQHKDALEEMPVINLYRFAHIIIHDTLKEGMQFDEYMEYYIDDVGAYIWEEEKKCCACK